MIIMTCICRHRLLQSTQIKAPWKIDVSSLTIFTFKATSQNVFLVSCLHVAMHQLRMTDESLTLAQFPPPSFFAPTDFANRPRRDGKTKRTPIEPWETDKEHVHSRVNNEHDDNMHKNADKFQSPKILLKKKRWIHNAAPVPEVMFFSAKTGNTWHKVGPKLTIRIQGRSELNNNKKLFPKRLPTLPRRMEKLSFVAAERHKALFSAQERD